MPISDGKIEKNALTLKPASGRHFLVENERKKVGNLDSFKPMAAKPLLNHTVLGIKFCLLKFQIKYNFAVNSNNKKPLIIVY